jgi:hypothetical protein
LQAFVPCQRRVEALSIDFARICRCSSRKSFDPRPATGFAASWSDTRSRIRSQWVKRGKLADLVILYRNALKVEHEALRDLEVIETIKQGRTVYRANAARDRSEL